MARRLSAEAAGGAATGDDDAPIGLGGGSVRFVELDAERMGEFFATRPDEERFDCVWISEAMSHLPDKELFFRNAANLLGEGGKLVVADWFRGEGLTEEQVEADIKPIEGMTAADCEGKLVLTKSKTACCFRRYVRSPTM